MTRAVTMSDFRYMIKLAKIIYNNDIIAKSSFRVFSGGYWGNDHGYFQSWHSL